jgi:hypothetical protein
VLSQVSRHGEERVLGQERDLPERKSLEFPTLLPRATRLPHLLFGVSLRNAVHNRHDELSNDFDNLL